ncbi:MAG: hypothetical protein GPJ54_12695 [Candidatus Heimdallarchaeota archaeon]|nr:hypothetical protein [Candidatus Heimdallarchaeota archaeon]
MITIRKRRKSKDLIDNLISEFSGKVELINQNEKYMIKISKSIFDIFMEKYHAKIVMEVVRDVNPMRPFYIVLVHGMINDKYVP